MKKSTLVFMLFITLLLAGVKTNAQSTLVHYWNFNNFAEVDSTTAVVNRLHPIAADYSTITTRTASILYTQIPGTSSTFFSYLDGYTTIAADYDTVNLQMGDTAGVSLRPRNPTDSMQLMFYLPTTNYKNLVLAYGTYSSSVGSGPLHQIFDYSTDSGATWKTSGLSITSDSAWVSSFNRVSVNFYGDTTVNNNSKLIFRLKFMGNTSGSSGNNRFDNVTLKADTITAATIYTGTTAVNNVVAGNATCSIYPNPVTNDVNIVFPNNENKTVTIINAAGTTVYVGMENSLHANINVSNLAAGTYYVQVHGLTSQTMQTIRFVKQ